jgi:hypothetical protein
LSREAEEKRPLGRDRHRWEDDIHTGRYEHHATGAYPISMVLNFLHQ